MIHIEYFLHDFISIRKLTNTILDSSIKLQGKKFTR